MVICLMGKESQRFSRHDARNAEPTESVSGNGIVSIN